MSENIGPRAVFREAYWRCPVALVLDTAADTAGTRLPPFDSSASPFINAIQLPPAS